MGAGGLAFGEYLERRAHLQDLQDLMLCDVRHHQAMRGTLEVRPSASSRNMARTRAYG